MSIALCPQAIELRNDQHVARFQLVKQLAEAGALGGGRGTRHGFGNDARGGDREAGGGNLLRLIRGGLLGGAHTTLGENAEHLLVLLATTDGIGDRTVPMFKT